MRRSVAGEPRNHPPSGLAPSSFGPDADLSTLSAARAKRYAPGSWYHRCIPLTRWLGRHPRLAGQAGGWLLAAFVAALFCITAVRLRVQQIEEGHQLVMERMQAVQQDVGRLLGELNAADRAVCSEQDLKRLRGVMFGHRYARNIGLLDDAGNLYCTTGLGLLDAAAARMPGGFDGAIGRYYLRTPVSRFVGSIAGAQTGTVLERGRYQVLIDSGPTVDAYSEHTDAVWAGGGAQRTRVFKGLRGDLTDSPVAADTPRVRIDWKRARLVVTTTAPGISPVSLQSVLSASSVDPDRMTLLAVALALCALCGFLTASAVRRRCRYFQSMDYRIRHLCAPSNVVCHFQPILELATGRVVGCEVLARLRDGDRLVFPDQFIPALNRRGLGWTFDAEVSRAALRELGAALPPQDDFSIALNFFPHNLKRDVIHRHLQAVLDEIGRTDLHVELEVTEYDFSPDLAPELRRLKADGYGISIDDFGTGYSNLGIVKRVAPDHLKIDKSFVFEMEDETIRSNLIPEIIAIAKAVGSDVVAEGIETAAQHAQLLALGVRFGQGYHFAKPMALADLLVYMESRST